MLLLPGKTSAWNVESAEVVDFLVTRLLRQGRVYRMRASCGASSEGGCARLRARAPLQASLTWNNKLLLKLFIPAKTWMSIGRDWKWLIPVTLLASGSCHRSGSARQESFEAYSDPRCCHEIGRRPLCRIMAQARGQDEQKVFCCCQAADSSGQLS